MTIRRFAWVWLIPLLLLVCWLGARGLNANAIWYDEWWSIYYSGSAPQYGPASLADTWGRVAETDHELNPPGYYLVINAWSRLVGGDPYTLRVWSLLLGALALAFVYRAGRDIVSPAAGLGAAVALGLSSFFVHYLYEGRAYMQLALLTAAALWSYWRLAIRRRSPLGIYALFLLSLVGLLYTHYMAVPVLAAAGLYHLLFARKDRQWWRVTLLAALALLLFLPWFGVALKAFSRVSADPARDFFARDPITLVSRLLYYFSNGSVALLAVFAWYALLGRRLIWFWLIVALALALAVNAVFRFITDVHYLMALWPLLALVVGLGTARMAAARLRPWVLLGVWVGAGILTSLSPDYNFKMKNETMALHLPWDTVARQMGELAQPDDTLVFFLPEPVPNWLHLPVSDYYLDGLPIRHEVVDSPAAKPEEKYREEAETFVDESPRVWIARQPDNPPLPIVDHEFQRVFDERGYAACGVLYDTPDLRLSLYAHTPADPTAAFDDGITLRMLLAPLPANAAERLPVFLGWTVDETVPPNTYSVGLHVENADGQLLAQADYGLPPVGFTCVPTYISLQALLPGEYRLLATVYDWQRGDRLPGMLLATGEQGDRVVLGRFKINS